MTTSVEWQPGVFRRTSDWPIFAEAHQRAAAYGLEDAGVLTISTQVGTNLDLDRAAVQATRRMLNFVSPERSLGTGSLGLFVADSAWQPSVTRAEYADGLALVRTLLPDVPRKSVLSHHLSRDGEKVKRSHVVSLDPSDTLELATVLRRSRTAFLLIADSAAEFPPAGDIFDWSFGCSGQCSQVSWGGVIPELLVRSVMPVFISGSFDDPAAVIDVFATSKPGCAEPARQSDSGLPHLS
ncbi:hypothetical protein J4G33_05425 [Actinotalea sp. BY-33]|uniref:Uncharacterized protein n=1 Tax=Actinotalea soli TaxID=2819234 RepID=A0A939RV40_9CELL|nr:hypothetical protein [Actinotalea soli]MBO1751238.1 hypothetical protein [Actinotalea soli]